MKVTLIRHSTTYGNSLKRYVGCRTDEPLSNEGKALAESYRPHYETSEKFVLFSSPMKRCIETCSIIFPDTTPIIVDDLKEMDFGIFENLNFQELSDNSQYREWVENNCLSPVPDGEDIKTFTERSFKAFRNCLNTVPENYNAVFCIHGGSIMAIMSRLFQGDYFSYHVKNCEEYSFYMTSSTVIMT